MCANGNIEHRAFWGALMDFGTDSATGFLEDRDAPKAAAAWDQAFEDDPVIAYIRADVKESRRRFIRRQGALTLVLHGWIRTRVAITVDHGASVVIAMLPEASFPRGLKENAIDCLVQDAFHFASQYKTREQRKREREFHRKMNPVIAEKIGHRKNSMIFVPLVFTAPESQGHGYASALLRKIGHIADLSDRACWLQSSNTANEPFYNSHGFVTVGETLLGDDNPRWDGDPIPVQLMVREPRVL